MFFIMKYFKNKLITSKETSPVNLDGLGVQGRPSKKSSTDLILVLLLMTCMCSVTQEVTKNKSFLFLSQVIRRVGDQLISASSSRLLNQQVLECKHSLCS